MRECNARDSRVIATRASFVITIVDLHATRVHFFTRCSLQTKTRGRDARACFVQIVFSASPRKRVARKHHAVIDRVLLLWRGVA